VNGTTSHFAYDLSSGTPLILTDGTTDYVYGPGGLPIEQVTSSGSPIYLAQDQLGSTRLLTNSSGAVVGTYSYDPAGNITSETGTATTNLLFAGQYLDQESGLYWMRARYYDPATAQFISVDPLNTGATSPYSYASDNPVNFTDPSGALTPTAAQLCSYGNTAGCQAASAVPQYTPLNVVVLAKGVSAALSAISTTADGTALVCEVASLGFCSPIAGTLIVASAASSAAASGIDIPLTVTGHESGAQVPLDLLGTLGVYGGLAGLRAVGEDAPLIAHLFFETNSLALGVPASVLAVWNLQARGGPHAASPALGIICGV
jgi:RHS repeat-associated protein